ncbi:MAG: hypothetical protein ACLPUO_22980 [Streptosporangiaceae bacterium]|jgi:hypothetical protein
MTAIPVLVLTVFLEGAPHHATKVLFARGPRAAADPAIPGALLFNAEFPAGVNIYRACRLPWKGGWVPPRHRH